MLPEQSTGAKTPVRTKMITCSSPAKHRNKIIQAFKKIPTLTVCAVGFLGPFGCENPAMLNQKSSARILLGLLYLHRKEAGEGCEGNRREPGKNMGTKD